MLTMGVLRMSIAMPSFAIPAVDGVCVVGSSRKLAAMMSCESDATTGDSVAFCGAMRFFVGCALGLWESESISMK